MHCRPDGDSYLSAGPLAIPSRELRCFFPTAENDTEVDRSIFGYCFKHMNGVEGGGCFVESIAESTSVCIVFRFKTFDPDINCLVLHQRLPSRAVIFPNEEPRNYLSDGTGVLAPLRSRSS